MKKSLIGLATIGAIGALSLIQSNRGEVTIKDGDFRGKYVVDTSNRPHKVSYFFPPGVYCNLLDDDLDRKPDRLRERIISKERINEKEEIVLFDLPETSPCHPDEVRMYQEVMKRWGYWERSIWSKLIYQEL